MTIWAPRLQGRKGPRYLAIADALAEDTRSGRLRAGARLPTHRDLAGTLGVTVGTVSRAYAEAARRGLLSGEVGRGTFARGQSAEVSSGSAATAEVVDLSLNLPPTPQGEDPGRELAQTLVALSHRADLATLLDYPPDGGAPAHREAGADWIARAGLDASADRVLVSNGSQHGLTAVLLALLQPGDLVVTESLTYPGLKALAGLLHLRVSGLAMDADGLLPDAFEAACRGGAVKALYCVPTVHNPTTAILPEARRREVAQIALRHGVAIVEDDVHGLLPEAPPSPIAAFAPEISYYLTGTAKSVAAGLRVGYILSPSAMVSRLMAGIRATTWMATPLMAEIAATWVRDGTAERVLKARRREARARWQIANAILSGFTLQSHPAAYHLWLHLPEPWRSETLADQARRHGVAVTPAQAFLVGRASAPHAVRVCLGAARDREQLAQALRALATILAGEPDAGLLVV